MTEFWTIYEVPTGAIRTSGSGPAGSGSWQFLKPDEALALLRSNPATQRVVIGADGQPTLENL